MCQARQGRLRLSVYTLFSQLEQCDSRFKAAQSLEMRTAGPLYSGIGWVRVSQALLLESSHPHPRNLGFGSKAVQTSTSSDVLAVARR